MSLLLAAAADVGLPRAGGAQQPDAPPLIEEVRIQRDGVVLAGSVLTPSTPGPHPGVVLVSGSGPNDRFETVAHDFRMLGAIADHLVARGHVVLMYDKRGVGQSSGNWSRESIDGRARDALAAVAALRARPGVDGARVGLLGHSQGGWVVQLAASRSPDVAYVVMVAGPSVTVKEQILHDVGNERRLGGASEQDVTGAVTATRWWLAVADALAPACRLLRIHYLCHVVEYDPAASLARTTVPVLALYGERDPLVPPVENTPRLLAGLRAAGNQSVTTRVFAEANHFFWPARTGSSREYRELRHEFVPGFLDAISSWIALQQPLAPAEADVPPRRATR